MKIISHRGNLKGRSNQENHPDHITTALQKGLDCEIDLWVTDNTYFLGHDKPQYEVKKSFLTKKGLWIHCKNLKALEKVPTQSNFFWHQNDDFTLTSKGYIWTFPTKNLLKNSVIVDTTEDWKNKNYNCFGVCADYIL